MACGKQGNSVDEVKNNVAPRDFATFLSPLLPRADSVYYSRMREIALVPSLGS